MPQLQSLSCRVLWEQRLLAFVSAAAKVSQQIQLRGNFGVATLAGALLEPLGCNGCCVAFFGNSDPLRLLFAGGGEGFVTTGLTLGTCGTATLDGALPGPSDETAVASRSLGAANPSRLFWERTDGRLYMDTAILGLLYKLDPQHAK